MPEIKEGDTVRMGTQERTLGRREEPTQDPEPTNDVEPEADPTPDSVSQIPEDYEQLKAFHDQNQVLFEYLRQPGVMAAVEAHVQGQLPGGVRSVPTPVASTAPNEETPKAGLVDISTLSEEDQENPTVRVLVQGLNQLATQVGAISQPVQNLLQQNQQHQQQQRLRLQAIDNAQKQYGMTFENAAKFVDKLTQDPEWINKTLVDDFKAQIAVPVETPIDAVTQERLEALGKKSDAKKPAAAGPSTRESVVEDFNPEKDTVRIGGVTKLRARAKAS